MIASRYSTISNVDAQHFLEKGYLRIEQCFSRDFAAGWREQAYIRMDVDPGDPSTWNEARVHMPTLDTVNISELAPRAWGAICDILGGEERIGGQYNDIWGDCFIVNFSSGADKPWNPPSIEAGGWHKDGDFFRHYLDSPEQGLLSIVLWSDIEPKSGGTFFSPDSVGHVARHLLEHPEGVPPGGCGGSITHCTEFGEITGRAGDVFLIHPFMLHASSQNPSGRPRFITNPPVNLKEPMQFNRENPEEYSLVERKILNDLGLESLDFQITGERERIVPERVKKEAEEIKRQKARLGRA